MIGGLRVVAVWLLLSLAAYPQGYRTPGAPLPGSTWYPEQWPEPAWERDLTLMHDAGFNVVRVGEFAWSTLEPKEGQYDWTGSTAPLDWPANMA
jgi:beta-galactosidase